MHITTENKYFFISNYAYNLFFLISLHILKLTHSIITINPIISMDQMLSFSFKIDVEYLLCFVHISLTLQNSQNDKTVKHY